MAKKPFGSLPFEAWAVVDNVRVVGGEAYCPVFWAKSAAKAFIATKRTPALYRLERVMVMSAHLGSTSGASE